MDPRSSNRFALSLAMTGARPDDRRMKLVVTLVALLLLASFLTRLPAVRRALLALLGILALYAVLKVTGVIEAIAPHRDGVF